jgi:hypothetical protein
MGHVIAFRVQLNRDEPVTAGLPGDHVVSVHADDHRAIYRKHRRRETGTGLRLSLRGLRTAEGSHVSWLRGPLSVGDEITIAVVSVREFEISDPSESGAATGSKSEASERERLAYLLKKYPAPVDA